MKIIYTQTDEAPALATRSLLPIIRLFASSAGVDIETRDISLAARILAQFPERLRADQQIHDALAELGELVQRPEANIIKLPNISASIPQLKAAIQELQGRGYALPDFPDDPETDDERNVRARYGKILGSAVNPVLREGNSDRRAPQAVKQYARNHPHSMGDWSPGSQTRVATMHEGDFFANEISMTIETGQNLRIELVSTDGDVVALKEQVPVEAGEIVDGTFMDVAKLKEFLQRQLKTAREQGILFSLHLKATMMKVSDPIIFGHAVQVYFADVFEKYAADLAEVEANPNNGLGNVLAAVAKLPADKQQAIEEAIGQALEAGPDLAMVNSDRGITNLHVPSDVIVDASMPAMIRSSGQMWNKRGRQQDTLAVIPDSSYAGVFQQVIESCQQLGAFDPTTMGTVPNVGLMAQKAEEYGSHDTTFEMPAAGTVRVLDENGIRLMEHQVAAGDIWRMCRVKDAAVKNWVELAVTRAAKHDAGRGAPAVFWLNQNRPHDAQLIRKVKHYLTGLDTSGLQIEIRAPVEAAQFTLERVRQGADTISVTGNVLRDYLTDLFPILELGTSAKMLSIVPLMNGGGLFETGAGGSAPKHVQQFNQENHLRWDSLGEFLALAVSLEHLAEVEDNQAAQVIADALDSATGMVLENGKSPSRKVKELDNRGSHFYLALYWAQALAEQQDDAELRSRFQPLADALSERETTIVDELNRVQGPPQDIGGYYFPDEAQVELAMRPSATFNAILNDFAGLAVN